LDFTMPEGTAVHAARSGVVIQLVDKNNQGCGNETCKNFNNYINILHDDGSIANYSHLQQNGVSCQLGQRVNAGDRIGWSGNTGWSTGPHLHFIVFLPQFGKVVSQDTYFLVKGQKTLLQEGSSYGHDR
ncbi:MAG: M23 family metallopeptidase, partial [Sphingobacteriia bacterium]